MNLTIGKRVRWSHMTHRRWEYRTGHIVRIGKATVQVRVSGTNLHRYLKKTRLHHD